MSVWPRPGETTFSKLIWGLVLVAVALIVHGIVSGDITQIVTATTVAWLLYVVDKQDRIAIAVIAETRVLMHRMFEENERLEKLLKRTETPKEE